MAAVPLTSCVVMDKLLTLSDFRFLICRVGIIMSTQLFHKYLMEINYELRIMLGGRNIKGHLFTHSFIKSYLTIY